MPGGNTEGSQECNGPKVEVSPTIEREMSDDITDDDDTIAEQFEPAAESLGTVTNEDGICRSTHARRAPEITRVSFQNKRYSLDRWN